MVNERYFSGEGALAYARKYERSAARRLSSAREKRCVRLALEAVDARGAILDLPCGAGRFQNIIAEHADKCFAGDLSFPMLLLCGERARMFHLPSHRFLADVFALPLREGALDGIVVMRLLHHISSPEQRHALLAEVARVARRFLVLSFLDAGSVKQRFARLRQHLGRRPGRRSALAREVLAAEIEAFGFRVLGFFPVSSLFSGQTVAACVRR
ncbi:MAG: class I SAM-dependent methyltransferase [Planctomycetota bacterium]